MYTLEITLIFRTTWPNLWCEYCLLFANSSKWMLAGGVAQFPGLLSRLQMELTTMRPFGSSSNVRLSSRPALSAWLGARDLASNSEQLARATISRAAYEEKGGEYLQVHPASNPFWTPLVPVPDIATPEPTSVKVWIRTCLSNKLSNLLIIINHLLLFYIIILFHQILWPCIKNKLLGYSKESAF